MVSMYSIRPFVIEDDDLLASFGYEAMGFSKIAELCIPNPKLPGYTCYIYAKTL